MSFDVISSRSTARAGWTLVNCALTVGATGAVTAVSGKRFATDGTATGSLGGIARDSEAVYTVTLPGTGACRRSSR